jgi:acyl-ACP thioesterase
MNYYRKKIEVDIHDVDFNGIAKASSLLRYIQSAAQSQLTDNGLSYDAMKDKKRAFIISRIKMEFTESVKAYDTLDAITFPCDSRGYSFLRCYSLEKGGATIGRAVSVWALIDTDTHSLIKVNDFELGLETFSPLDMVLTRIAHPSEMSMVGTYRVSYGMVDQNMHMNNTAYPDMYSNFLPLEGKRIRSLTISYNAEAPFGELLTVYRGYSDGAYYIRTVREDGKINSEAEIILCSI